MANYRVGSGLGQVNQVAGKTGRVNKRVILNVLKTGWANRVAGGLCEFGPTHIYTWKKKKQITAKFLERMNQINQGNKLYNTLCFFPFKWAPTIIRLFVLLLYMWREKKNKSKNIKLSISFQILIVLCMNKILYIHNNKIFHVNKS